MTGYVRWLSTQTAECVLAFYVDERRSLLAVDAVAKGGTSTVTFSVGKLIYRGMSIQADGFFLVHNHPSGDPNPSTADIETTKSIHRTSIEMGMPLLDHFIVAAGRILSVGMW